MYRSLLSVFVIATFSSASMLRKVDHYDPLEYVLRDLAEYEPKRATTREALFAKWDALGGPSLMQLTSEQLHSPLTSEAAKLDYLDALMRLATNLDRKLEPAGLELENVFRNFSIEMGLADFCLAEKDTIQVLLLKGHKKWASSSSAVRRYHMMKTNPLNVAAEFGFAAEWEFYCPYLINTTRLRGIVLLHRLARRFALTDSSDGHYFEIRRSHAFEDAVDRLNGPVTNYRSYFDFQFTGEPDKGMGVRREFFGAIGEQIFNPNFGYFELSVDTPHYTMLNISTWERKEDAVEYLQAVGRFIGLSLLNDVSLGVNFPVMFYAYLLDTKLSLDDIADDEPVLFRSLTEVMNMQILPESLEMEFEAGEFIRVTEDNRAELIKRKVNSVFSATQTLYLEHIKTGFLDVIPRDTMNGLVSTADLRDIIYGNPNIDIDDLKQHVVLADGYHDESPQIKWLFDLLESYSMEMRSKFLMLVTGNPRLPAGGFASLPMHINIRLQDADDSYFPRTFTCYNLLSLPHYSSEFILTERVTRAIAEAEQRGEE